ncbi:MAG: hypothetical protein PVG66_16210 [Chromatiales bacterium]|jgi:hypothetical protein
MSEKNDETTSSFGSGLAGLLGGILLAIVYIKFGFSLPGWLQPAETFQQGLTWRLASLTVDDNNLEELQREIALQMQDPDFYVASDNALGGFITQELVWRDKTVRSLTLLRAEVNNLRRLSADQHEGIKNSIQRLLQNLPAETRQEKQLLSDFLRLRFPQASDAQIIDQISKLSLPELLQMPVFATTIIFLTDATANYSVKLFDETGQNIKTLLKGELPAGKYRLYWDFTNDEGRPVDRHLSYRYEIQRGGLPVRSGKTLPSSDPVRQ